MRVRIKRGNDEIEVEGTAAEVEKYLKRYDAGSGLPAAQAGKKDERDGKKAPAKHQDADFTFPDEPGEYLSAVPNNAKQVTQFLVGAHWVQHHSEDNTYTTAAVRALLDSHGMKLSNPSDCNGQNVKAKKAFAVAGGFRLHKKATDEVRKLLTGGETE